MGKVLHSLSCPRKGNRHAIVLKVNGYQHAAIFQISLLHTLALHREDSIAHY